MAWTAVKVPGAKAGRSVPELAVHAGGHDTVDVEGAHRVADV